MIDWRAFRIVVAASLLWWLIAGMMFGLDTVWCWVGSGAIGFMLGMADIRIWRT